MSILRILNNPFTEGVIDLIWPRVCVSCERSLSVEEQHDPWKLCQPCKSAMKRPQAPLCDRCGESFSGKINAGFECPNCRQRKLAFSHARSAFRVQEVSRNLVHRLKYAQQSWIAPAMSSMMLILEDDPVVSQGVKEKWPLVPVPIHRVRFRQRGYNQAEELARGLSEVWGCPLWKPLHRKRWVHSQTRLGREERLHNLADTFAIKFRWPWVRRRWMKKLKGQSLFLLDDVLTTGATANACAEELLSFGVMKVVVITFVRG